MDTVRESYDHSTNIGTFLEGEMQGACDDACSICLEDFSESDPSTVLLCNSFDCLYFHGTICLCLLEIVEYKDNTPSVPY